MTDRDSDERFDKGQSKQTIGGQQSHESEYGEQGDQTADASDEEIIWKEAFGGSGAEPAVGSTPPLDEVDGEVDQPASDRGENVEGEGFILRPEEEDEASSEGGVG